MQILLAAINSQYMHSNPVLYALTRAAENAGCGDMLQTGDYSINMPVLRVMEKLYRPRPEVLAFSVYIWNSEYLRALTADLRTLLPDTLILLGGPEASMRPRHYLDSLSADGVCVGEGEEVFAAFLQRYKNEETAAPPTWIDVAGGGKMITGPRPGRISHDCPFSITVLIANICVVGERLFTMKAVVAAPLAALFAPRPKNPYGSGRWNRSWQSCRNWRLWAGRLNLWTAPLTRIPPGLWRSPKKHWRFTVRG